MAGEDDEPTVDIEESAPSDDGIEGIDSDPADAAETAEAAEHAPEPSEPVSEPTSAPVAAAPRSRVRLIAVAAGRGGTGRSLLAANVAVYLAQAAKKVVAIDADPAGGPLH